jgi:ABC-type glycerol-3-phosphate transport system substrate-binding protein
MGASTNIDNSADILSLLMLQNSTKMTDDTRQSARFNNFVPDASNKPVYPGTNALDFYTSFALKSKSNYSWSSSMPNAYQSFINGKVAMLVGYQHVVQSLKQDAPTLMYEVSYMPQVKGGETTNFANYWTETVTNNCKNPSEAWKFLQYITMRPNSYLSSTRRSSALLGDPTIPISYDVFPDQVQTALTWNMGKYPDDMNKIFRDMITNVVANNQPPQQAIDSAAALATDALQKD